MMFADRSDAGRKLGRLLARFRDTKPVVLALPRGGVEVAVEIAAALDAALDVILVRKIGVPGQPELAMGAVVDGGSPTIVRNEDILRVAGIGETSFDAVCRRELDEIERRRRVYVGGRRPTDVAGRVVIVVDDGIATGATVRAALQATRRRGPAKLVLAVPVAATDALERLRADTDDVVCLEANDRLGSVGAYYADFRQLTDADVIALLARAHARASASQRAT